MGRILLLILLAPSYLFAQPLSGNYLIGPSQPAPFNTITAAVNRLNASGVSGPVTFLLDSNTYSNATGEIFPVTINQFPGTSSTNTVTIRPNAGKTVTIIGSGINSWTPVTAIFKFNAADNVIIDGSNNGSSSQNLTITNANTLDYAKRAVIWIANVNSSNGSNNITITNTILRHDVITGDLAIGIYSGGTAIDNNVAQAPNSNVSISNVRIAKAGQGIWATGSTGSSSQTQQWTITGSTFGATADSDKGFLGIYMNNIKNFNITNNTFDGFLKTTTSYNPVHAAIYTIGTCIDGTISTNRINNVRETTGSASTGIYVTGTNMLVYNNFVMNVRGNGNGGIANNGHGIYINSGSNISIYHNSVRMGENQNNGTSAAMFVNSGSGLNIRNNIFVNAQTGGPSRYAIYSVAGASAYANIDYNNYYSSQHIGYMGSNKPNLSQWKSATGKDSHSVSIAPPFISANDLHIATATAASLNDLGIPIAGITTDIDGDVRSTTKPDMGADEFDIDRCPVSTTWSGSSWSNGVPTLTKKTIINGNYSTASGSLKTCELTVNAGATVTINAGQYIEVENDIAVNGNLTVGDKGALIQNSDDAAHSGNITVKRRTSPLKQYDYTYWSSPIAAANLATLGAPSIYYMFSPTINNWSAVTASALMTPGKGYIARVPNNLNFSTPQVVEATFTGLPNTGIIAAPVTKGTGTFNLIGNPYPSAIDIDQFLVDEDNAPYINGTVYLWTHNTAISAANSGSNAFNYTRDDYAKYNVTGGVKTATAAANSSNSPTGKVASGQGFFVEALQNGTVYFKNYMRTKGANNNGQFFRTRTSPENNALEKHRLWINISNPEGAYNETLLGYVEGATNGLDRAYDGKINPAGNVVELYSILGDTHLAIQGRALPFNASDVIPLGYITTVAGSFTMAIEQFDGIFGNQTIYLRDKLTDTLHNLSENPYAFETQTGTFNDRFEISFTDSTLGTNDNIAGGFNILVRDKAIIILSPDAISKIDIFDLTGRRIYSATADANEFTTQPLPVAPQALLVNVSCANGARHAAKVVVR